MRGVHPVRGPPGYCTDRKSLSIYGSRTDRVRCNRTARSSGTLRLAIGAGEIIKDNSSLFMPVMHHRRF